MGKHPNPKPQTTRTQDPTKLLVGEGERGKKSSRLVSTEKPRSLEIGNFACKKTDLAPAAASSRPRFWPQIYISKIGT